MWFVQSFATDAQKREIIEIYVLGKSVQVIWPISVVCALAVAVVLAQKRYYDKKVAELQSQIDTVALEKSRLQESQAQKALSHGTTNQGKRSK